MSGLPVGWRVQKLGSIATVIAGQSPPGSTYNVTGAGVPFFQGKAEFGTLVPQVRKYTSDGKKFADKGDVLLSVRAPVGPTNLAPGYCAIGRGLMAVKPHDGLESRYLLWALRSRADHLASQGAGSTFAAVTGKQVRALELPVPPIDEQRRIVDILEDHLSRLDAARAGLEHAGRRLATHGVSALNALIPSGARTVELGELAIRSGYGTSAKCTPDGGGLAVVRIPNIRDRRIDLTDEKRVLDPSHDVSNLMLSPGELLVIRTNGSRDLIGRTAVVQSGVKASFASYLIRFQLDRALVSPEWVSLMLETPQSRRILEGLAASSAGQYNLSVSKLNRVAIPLIDRDEQDSAIAEFADGTASARRLRLAIDVADVRTRSLRRSLLAAAFSGKLTGAASDIDRIEEMAS